MLMLSRSLVSLTLETLLLALLLRDLLPSLVFGAPRLLILPISATRLLRLSFVTSVVLPGATKLSPVASVLRLRILALLWRLDPLVRVFGRVPRRWSSF